MNKKSDFNTGIATTAMKALDTLEVLAASPHPLSAQEISDLMEIPRSTVYRLLRTLITAGYVDDLPEAKYRISTKILKIGRSVLDQLEIPQLAKPILRELRGQTGEMSLLAIREDLSLFYIGKFETTHSVRTHTRMGTSGNLHSTALGKVILAFMHDAEREDIINRLNMSALTPNTITNKRVLHTHLADIQDLGYAVEIEENQLDICSIAAPVFNHMDDVVAALGTSGPAYRIDKTWMKEQAPIVVAAARKVSQLLGSNR